MLRINILMAMAKDISGIRLIVISDVFFRCISRSIVL